MRAVFATSVLLEREAEAPEQRTGLVVGCGRGDDRDVHAAHAVDLVLVDLVEHRLLGQTEGVVAVAVELLGRQSAEVADARQRDRQQAVEELPHAVATQGGVGADRLALTQLELRDGLAGPGHLRLLAGDEGQVADGALDELGVARGVPDTHVDDDLRQRGHLVDVRVVELLAQGVAALVAVTLLEPRDRGRGGLTHLRCPYRNASRRGYAACAPRRRARPARCGSRPGCPSWSPGRRP